jgi:hypothetical protein
MAPGQRKRRQVADNICLTGQPICSESPQVCGDPIQVRIRLVSTGLRRSLDVSSDSILHAVRKARPLRFTQEWCDATCPAISELRRRK